MPNNMKVGRGNEHAKFAEKPKNFKKSIGSLVKYLKPYYLAIVVALVFAIGGTVFNILAPEKLGQISTLIAKGLVLPNGIDLAQVTRIGITLVAMYAACALLSYVQSWIMTGVTQSVSKKFRKEISEKINKLPLSYFDARSYGDVLSRVTNDVDTIGQTLNQSLAQIVSSVTMLGGLLIMMFVTSWQLALVPVVTVPISMILMVLIVSISQKYFKQQQTSLGDLNGHIEEVFSSHNVIKAFNAEERVTYRFDAINNKLYSSAWRSQFLSGMMQPIMMFVGNLGFVGVCVVGGILALQHQIEFGVIISFMMYVRMFSQPLATIAQVTNTMQSTAAAAERVFEFLNEKELCDESDKTVVLENIEGHIEFKNVNFGYSADKLVIKDFSADIKAGQKVAIVGPTGAGKTTLVNLLMRFYEVNSGEILIDGVPNTDITRNNVHALFGMVLQDTWLFDGSIRDNIIYSKNGVSDEGVMLAVKYAGLGHFVRTLPSGLDTILDESTNISQGQRQLLTIARAMVENAPMMILDEATSSVDTRTEILIQKAMDKLTEGRTCFIIAHRLSTIRNADLILVMKDGNIIEKGTHLELMAQNGFYTDLYNSQFEPAN